MNDFFIVTVSIILVAVFYNIYLTIDVKYLFKDKLQYKLPLHYYAEFGHTPLIKVKIGKKEYIFIIDTGCDDCLLDDKVFEEIITENLIPTKEEDYTVIGIHGPVKSTTHNVTLELLINELKFTQEFNSYDLSDALSQINKVLGTNCAGLLGMKFLNKNKAKIDFKHRVMLISKHDLYSK